MPLSLDATIMFNQSTYNVDENAGPVRPVVFISDPLLNDVTVYIYDSNVSATGEYYSILATIILCMNNMLSMQKMTIICLDHIL